MITLIIDNDSNVRSGLKLMLEQFCPQLTSISEASGVQDGLQKLKAIQPNIVFLDVEMDDGTGFDLMRQVQQINFSLIFITAYNKYAVTAFKFSAIDFLEKPIDPSDLVIAVNKAIENIQVKSISNQLEILQDAFANAQSKQNDDKKIVLNDGKAIHFLKVNDILYCKAEGSYTAFVLVNGNNILVSKNLKEYEDLLSDSRFVRCHHAYLVNLKKVLRFEKIENPQIILENHAVVPVSVRKKEFVLDALSRNA